MNTPDYSDLLEITAEDDVTYDSVVLSDGKEYSVYIETGNSTKASDFPEVSKYPDYFYFDEDVKAPLLKVKKNIPVEVMADAMKIDPFQSIRAQALVIGTEDKVIRDVLVNVLKEPDLSNLKEVIAEEENKPKRTELEIEGDFLSKRKMLLGAMRRLKEKLLLGDEPITGERRFALIGRMNRLHALFNDLDGASMAYFLYLEEKAKE